MINVILINVSGLIVIINVDFVVEWLILCCVWVFKIGWIKCVYRLIILWLFCVLWIEVY